MSTLDKSPAKAALDGRRILVVEDDFLIAQVLVDILEEAGAEIVGPIGWMEEAIAFLEQDAQKPDGAVLDINLHGRKSYPIADILISRSVPLVFATGYDADILDERYARYPRCEKPLNQNAVLAALAGAMSRDLRA